LNESYVFCRRQRAADTVNQVKKALERVVTHFDFPPTLASKMSRRQSRSSMREWNRATRRGQKTKPATLDLVVHRLYASFSLCIAFQRWYRPVAYGVRYCVVPRSGNLCACPRYQLGN
jgi:hypothetical protein